MGVRTHKRSENKTKPSGNLEWDTMTPDSVSGEKQYIREEPGSEGTGDFFRFCKCLQEVRLLNPQTPFQLYLNWTNYFFLWNFRGSFKPFGIQFLCGESTWLWLLMELVWKWLKLIFPLQVEPACVEVLLREDARKMLAEKPTDFIGNKICQKRNAPCHPKAIFEVPWPALCQLVVMNRHEERSAASIIFFTGKHCSGGQSCCIFFAYFCGSLRFLPLAKKKEPEKNTLFQVYRCVFRVCKRRTPAGYFDCFEGMGCPHHLFKTRKDLSSKSHQTPRCRGGRHQMPRTRTDAK